MPPITYLKDNITPYVAFPTTFSKAALKVLNHILLSVK